MKCFVSFLFVLVFAPAALSQDLRELREVKLTSNKGPQVYQLEYNRPVTNAQTAGAVRFLRAVEGLDPKTTVGISVRLEKEKVIVEMKIDPTVARMRVPALSSMRLKERDKQTTVYGVEYREKIGEKEEKLIIDHFVQLDAGERKLIKGWLPLDRTKFTAKLVRDPDDDLRKKGNIIIEYQYP